MYETKIYSIRIYFNRVFMDDIFIHYPTVYKYIFKTNNPKKNIFFPIKGEIERKGNIPEDISFFRSYSIYLFCVVLLLTTVAR